MEKGSASPAKEFLVHLIVATVTAIAGMVGAYFIPNETARLVVLVFTLFVLLGQLFWGHIFWQLIASLRATNARASKIPFGLHGDYQHDLIHSTRDAVVRVLPKIPRQQTTPDGKLVVPLEGQAFNDAGE